MADKNDVPLSAQVLAYYNELEDLLPEDRLRVERRVEALPRLLRDALESVLKGNSLPHYEYRGLSLDRLVSSAGSPVTAILWMGELLHDRSALVPLVRDSGEQLVVSNRDAHFSPATYSVIWLFGGFYIKDFENYLDGLGSVTGPLALPLRDLMAAIAVPAATTPADPDVIEESLVLGWHSHKVVASLLAESGWRREDQACVLGVSRVLLNMVAGEFDYAQRNGRVAMATHADRALVRPRHSPSDVVGMATTRLRDIADDKEITPAVVAKIRAEIETLGPEMRRVLAFHQWTGKLPDFQRGGFTLFDLGGLFDPVGAILQMDRLIRDRLIKDPGASRDVRRDGGTASEEPAGGAGATPGTSSAQVLLVAFAKNTRLFVELLGDYADERADAVLGGFKEVLGEIEGAGVLDALGAAASMERLAGQLASCVGDGTGPIGEEDLRRLGYGVDLVSRVIHAGFAGSGS
jgi:hypothetical protein